MTICSVVLKRKFLVDFLLYSLLTVGRNWWGCLSLSRVDNIGVHQLHFLANISLFSAFSSWGFACNPFFKKKVYHLNLFPCVVETFSKLSFFPCDRSDFLGTNFTIYDSQPPHNGAKSLSTRAVHRLASKQMSPQVPAGNFEIGQVSFKFNLLKSSGPRRMGAHLSAEYQKKW